MRPRSSLGFLPFPLFASFSLAALVAATGCSVHTTGDDGKAQFQYYTGNGCLLGCDTSHALMTGTSESLSVTDVPTGATLVSTSPAVVRVGVASATYQCNSSTSSTSSTTPSCPPGSTLQTSLATTIAALQVGSTDIQVLNRDGSLYDTVTVGVAAPARVQVVDSSNKPLTSLTVARGAIVDVSAIAFDAQGDQLQASSGFSFQSKDTSIADTQNGDFSFLSPAIPIHGDAAGATTVTVSAGGATATLAVTVD